MWDIPRIHMHTPVRWRYVLHFVRPLLQQLVIRGRQPALPAVNERLFVELVLPADVQATSRHVLQPTRR